MEQEQNIDNALPWNDDIRQENISEEEQSKIDCDMLEQMYGMPHDNDNQSK